MKDKVEHLLGVGSVNFGREGHMWLQSDTGYALPLYVCVYIGIHIYIYTYIEITLKSL